MTYDVKQIAIGVSGVNPSILLINTNNTIAEVTTTGYLGSSSNYSAVTFTDKQIAMVYTTDGGTGVYRISVDVDGIASLVGPNAGPISGTPNQIDVDDDVVSIAEDLVLPGDFAVKNLTITANEGDYRETTLEAHKIGSYPGTLYIKTGFGSTVGDDAVLGLNSGGSIQIVAGAPGGSVDRYGALTMATNAIDGHTAIGGDHIWLVAGSTAGSPDIRFDRIQAPIRTGIPANGGVRIVTPHNETLLKGVESFVALNDGQLLVGSTLGPPAAANVTSTNGLDIVNGANTIEINSKIYRFSVTVSQASLAAGGSATLFAGVVSKQFNILNLWTNFGGTNFSGGGGDRLLSITDNTTAYSVVPAASLQALANTGWGATGLPYPASAAIDTSTASGASLVAKYSGGTTDYTAGSVTISGVLQMV